MTTALEYYADLKRQIEDESSGSAPGSTDFLEIAGSDEKILALISRLIDPDAPSVEKIDVINTLQIAGNFSKTLPTRTAELSNALRGLITAPDEDLRRQALSALVLMKDEVAEQHLRVELETGGGEAGKSVSTHEAIAMLSVYDKGVDKATLLAIAKDPPDQNSFTEAIRHLPADAETADLLMALVADADQPMAAPASAAAALSRALDAQAPQQLLTPRMASSVENMRSARGDADLANAVAEVRALILGGRLQVEHRARRPGSSGERAAAD